MLVKTEIPAGLNGKPANPCRTPALRGWRTAPGKNAPGRTRIAEKLSALRTPYAYHTEKIPNFLLPAGEAALYLAPFLSPHILIA